MGFELWPDLWPLWAAVAGLDAFAVVRAISRGHGVDGTLAWVFAILAFPGVGALMYLALASPSIKRAARRKRETARTFRVEPDGVGARSGVSVVPGSNEDAVLRLAVQLTDLEPTDGNHAEVLADDERAFAAIEGAVAGATRSVWAESYIIRPDETGSRFLDALVRKASEGVEVRLLYDAVGSIGIDADRIEAIRAAGGHVQAFLPVNPLHRRWSVHLRNHRKLIVVDGEVGFTGGMNIGDEYSGRLRRRIGKLMQRQIGAPQPPKPTNAFHDTHLLLQGPVVGQLAQIFAEDWSFAADQELALPPNPEAVSDADAVVAVVPSGPHQVHNATSLVYFAGIAAARQRVWLTSAYFVPDTAMMRALVSAALRGVDVRVLVPQKGDVGVVNAAARTYFPALVQAGVRVFQYQPSVLHAKSVVVDGSWSMVGSANVDIRSFRLNFELGALVVGRHLAEALERRFEADLQKSREVDAEMIAAWSFYERLRDGVARLLSPLL